MSNWKKCLFLLAICVGVAGALDAIGVVFWHRVWILAPVTYCAWALLWRRP